MSGIMSMLLGAVSSVAVAVDEFFNRVTLLLPGNGTNGAQNNTFLDSSSNNFTITRNGNTTQGTFSPFSQTGWSNYFDGSSRLDFPTTAPYQIGSSDFTYETWVYVTASGFNPTIYWNANSSGYAALAVRINSATGNPVRLSFSTSGSSWVADTDYGTTNLNTWNHIAVVRSGNNIKLYLNGVDITSGGVAVSGSLMTTYTLNQLAAYNSTSYRLTGYLSNTRIVIGAALYTSNFTPSTSPLTTTSQGATAAQTEILTCQSNRFVDNSDNGAAITVNGTPSVQAFSPFAPTAAYSAATVGGSGYFDGTGDYLSTPDNAAFDLGTGDFTFECWVYKPNNNDGAFICSAGNGLEISYVSGSLRIGRFGVAWDVTQLYTIPQNAWTHIAFTKASGRTYIFANGALLNAGGTANTNTYDTTTTLYVGVAGDATSRIFNGYIAGVRLIKGQSLATASFTPPTAPVTTSAVGWTGAASSITGTVSLLLNYTNAGITDATAKNDLETVGNSQISTTQSKFGGSSMYFDGTGDYLRIPTSQINSLGSGSWTIEFWIYRVGSGNQIFYDQRNTATQVAVTIYNDGSNILRFFVNGANQISDTTTFPSSTWTHVAVCKSGSSTRMFVNGAQVGSTYTDTNAYVNNPIFIGAQFDGSGTLNGYIDDLRVSLHARYTANFTAPTSAFALQ